MPNVGVQVLIRLKLITKEEWISELAQRMEEEVASYQKELERDYGMKVTLL